MIRRLAVLALLCSACGGNSPSAPTSTPPVVVAPAPTIITPPSHAPAGALFDLAFYRIFVHDGFEQPNALVPLRRLTAAPMIYLRTINDAGQAIDAVSLNATATAMRDVAAQWTGGQFGIAGIVQGTSTMQGQHGWLTVIWDAAPTAFCGQSDVGVDGGTIELAPKTAGCACPPSISTVAIRPRTVKHELGHAFGYWHTGNAGDLMSGLAVSQCDQDPSDRERYHAAVAYQSAVGSVDRLPTSSRLSAGPSTIQD